MIVGSVGCTSSSTPNVVNKCHTVRTVVVTPWTQNKTKFMWSLRRQTKRTRQQVVEKSFFVSASERVLTEEAASYHGNVKKCRKRSKSTDTLKFLIEIHK